MNRLFQSSHCCCAEPNETDGIAASSEFLSTDESPACAFCFACASSSSKLGSFRQYQK